LAIVVGHFDHEDLHQLHGTVLYLVVADEDLLTKNKNTFGVEYTQMNYDDKAACDLRGITFNLCTLTSQDPSCVE